MKQLTHQEIAALAQEEKNRPLVQMFQTLRTARGFYQYWYSQLPHHASSVECFNAVNDLHEQLFGEPKYSCMNSFDVVKKRYSQNNG